MTPEKRILERKHAVLFAIRYGDTMAYRRALAALKRERERQKEAK